MSTTDILLVDDNDDVREITALFLRDSGYNVTEASNGIVELSLLNANPAIELLIADLAMPEMSGTELLKQARATRPEIRAVFITGYADQPLISGNLKNEIVVQKPFTTEQLTLAVRTALGQSGE